MLVDRLAFLTWQTDRIHQAHTARLSTRMRHGEIRAADKEQKRVMTLGHRLFQEPGAPRAEAPGRQTGHSRRSASSQPYGPSRSMADHPVMLVHRLQETLAGCEWMLDQWAALRDLLDRGVPWLATDQRKAVRLLGQRSADVIDSTDAARVYLAGHMLLGQEGNPFQAVLDELTSDDAPTYAVSLRLRELGPLAPKDAAAARRMLREIVERAIEPLQEKAEVLREVAEADAVSAVHALAWDDTDEGERLRRYEMMFERAWFRTFDLLFKIRRTGGELDLGTIDSLGRSPVFARMCAIERSAPFDPIVSMPPAEPAQEPDAPIEAKSEREKAPNEANSSGSGVHQRTPGWAQRTQNRYAAPRSQSRRNGR